MIRFINVSNQIIENEFCFAWYDTIRDKFIKVNNKQVWSSWQKFEEDYLITGHSNSTFTLDRFSSLFYHKLDKDSDDSE